MIAFDEFQQRAVDTGSVGFRVTQKVFTRNGRGEAAVVEEPAGWRYLEPGGRWSGELHVLALWRTGGWGRNSSGSGRLSPEPERDIEVPIRHLLAGLGCESRSGDAVAALAANGTFESVEGDGATEEYEWSWAYRAIGLRALYDWLVERRLIGNRPRPA
jgi:hypothetical protein